MVNEERDVRELFHEREELDSQLINYQRTLAKVNCRLQGLLEEVRQASNTIDLLERDMLTGLLSEMIFYNRASRILELYPEQEFDILAVGIEQFKIVNEATGTGRGDRLFDGFVRLPSDHSERFQDADHQGKGGSVFCHSSQAEGDL